MRFPQSCRWLRYAGLPGFMPTGETRRSPLSFDQPELLLRIARETWEHFVQIAIAKVTRNNFAEHAAIVRGHGRGILSTCRTTPPWTSASGENLLCEKRET